MRCIMNISKKLIIDCINNCTDLDTTIEKEIDTIIDNIDDKKKEIEEKYNIEIYITYQWDYKN